MIPKNSFTITEESVFKSNPNSLLGKQYKLTILKRFEFSSKFQSSSVIIYNHLDGSYRYFIKGSPENLIKMCDPNSIPENLSQVIFDQIQNGYILMACASKTLDFRSDYKNSENRELFEHDLTFLGFIIFENKLKSDTKNIIRKLKESNCNIVITTGDNPFTTINIARQCQLIENNKEIYFCNLEKNNDYNSDKLNIYEIKLINNSTYNAPNLDKFQYKTEKKKIHGIINFY